MDTNEALLRAILATVARKTFPPAELYKMVAPTAGSSKQLAAYNLCDGKTPQTEIGKRANLDQGNLSRSIARWIEAGIMVRVGRDEHPMHVYPLTKAASESTGGENKRHG
jgi:DNA-binding MarR family transcriptional regulator